MVSGKLERNFSVQCTTHKGRFTMNLVSQCSKCRQVFYFQRASLPSEDAWPNVCPDCLRAVDAGDGGAAVEVQVVAAPAKVSEQTAKRFAEKVDATDSDGCHVWTGAKSVDGYGLFRSGDKVVRAHRMAWVIEHGEDIPGGKMVMHACDNPSCVNPAHLRLGTHAENMQERGARRRAAMGNRIAAAKLTPAAVRTIREWRALPFPASVGELAWCAGVCETTIRNVLAGKVWAWVDADRN
jgi:hypothetical protein